MKSRLFIKYVISYLLVLVIPVTLIGALNYGRFVGILSDEAANSAQGLLYQIRDVADVHIRELTVISYIINQKQNVSKLISGQEDGEDDTYPGIYNLIREFKDYKISNSMIDHIFLYLKGSDDVISDASKQDFNSEFGWSYIYEDIPAAALREKLNGIKGMTVWPSMKVNDGNGTKGVISYIRPMPIGSMQHKATLLVTINDSVFKQLIANILNEYSSTVLILDSDYNTILMTSTSNDEIGGEKLNKIIESIRSSQSKSHTEFSDGLLISYVKSDDTGWHYVAVLPSDQILDKVNYVKLRLVVILLITMLLGIFLSYFFSKGNYSNVKRIADVITASSRNNASQGGVNNEWELIDKAVSDYIVENKSLQQKLLDQMPVLKSDFLNRLLKGEFRDMDTVNSIMEFLKIEIKQSMLAVLIISIDDYVTFTNMHNELEQGIIKVALSEAIEEICGSSGRGYTVYDGNGRLAVIFDMDANNSDDAGMIENTGERIRAYVSDNFDFTVTVGVSIACGSILELRKAYTEACETVDYRMVKGGNSVICYSDILQNVNNRKFYSFKQESQIINYLRLGEYEAIRDILEEIVTTVKKEAISLNMGKCIYLEIINTAIKASDELGIDSSIFEQNLPSLVQQETLDGVCREVGRFYEYICRQANNAKSIKAIELVKKILEYLNGFYDDKSMSVELAAREFAVSSSYFSRFFKEQVGRNFVDYLHHLRLTRAKELLMSTEKSVTDIADEVGYNSIHNFVRVFKRYEGITPSEFRLK